MIHILQTTSILGIYMTIFKKHDHIKNNLKEMHSHLNKKINCTVSNL